MSSLSAQSTTASKAKIGMCVPRKLHLYSFFGKCLGIQQLLQILFKFVIVSVFAFIFKFVLVSVFVFVFKFVLVCICICIQICNGIYICICYCVSPQRWGPDAADVQLHMLPPPS